MESVCEFPGSIRRDDFYFDWRRIRIDDEPGDPGEIPLDSQGLAVPGFDVIACECIGVDASFDAGEYVGGGFPPEVLGIDRIVEGNDLGDRNR